MIACTYPNSRLIGFDSWQGLPPETSGVWAQAHHAAGTFSSLKDTVIQRLRENNLSEQDPRFRFVDGFFSDTLLPSFRDTIKDLIFVNIDVDIHRSTIELLDFIGPLLRPGVVIYWDDWKDPSDTHNDQWGEHLAWQQWTAANRHIVSETLEVNPINQRTMVVTQVKDRTLKDEAATSPLEVRHKAYYLGEGEV